MGGTNTSSLRSAVGASPLWKKIPLIIESITPHPSGAFGKTWFLIVRNHAPLVFTLRSRVHFSISVTETKVDPEDGRLTTVLAAYYRQLGF